MATALHLLPASRPCPSLRPPVSLLAPLPHAAIRVRFPPCHLQAQSLSPSCPSTLPDDAVTGLFSLSPDLPPPILCTGSYSGMLMHPNPAPTLSQNPALRSGLRSSGSLPRWDPPATSLKVPCQGWGHSGLDLYSHWALSPTLLGPEILTVATRPRVPSPACPAS